jgi:hypothetical protein
LHFGGKLDDYWFHADSIIYNGGRLLDESPRWLLVKERYDEAEIVIRKMATVNGSQLPVDFNIHCIQKVRPNVLHYDSRSNVLICRKNGGKVKDAPIC